MGQRPRGREAWPSLSTASSESQRRNERVPQLPRELAVQVPALGVHGTYHPVPFVSRRGLSDGRVSVTLAQLPTDGGCSYLHPHLSEPTPHTGQ